MARKRSLLSPQDAAPTAAPASKVSIGAAAEVGRTIMEANSQALIERLKDWRQALQKIEDEATQADCSEIVFLVGVILVATEDAVAELLALAC